MAAVLAASAAAHAFPEQPLQMIVPFAAGGSTDVLARAVAPIMERYLGGDARIVVINRPGASGDIGVTAIARAPADGYTFGIVSTPPLLTLPIERKTAYTWKSFDLLGNMVEDPVNFSVLASSPYRNLGELVTFARSHPGEVTVGTTGPGSDDHLAMLLLEKAAGIKLNHIPFKGSSEVRTALLSRVITVAAINVSEGVTYLKGGTPIRNLGQAAAVRSTLAPDLPTFREQGFDVELSAMRAMAAPRGLPPAVRERLEAALRQALADTEFRRQADEVFFQPVRYISPADLAKTLDRMDPVFRRLWDVVPWSAQ